MLLRVPLEETRNVWVFNVHPSRFRNRFVTAPVKTPCLRVKVDNVEVALVMLAEDSHDY